LEKMRAAQQKKMKKKKISLQPAIIKKIDRYKSHLRDSTAKLRRIPQNLLLVKEKQAQKAKKLSLFDESTTESKNEKWLVKRSQSAPAVQFDAEKKIFTYAPLQIPLQVRDHEFFLYELRVAHMCQEKNRKRVEEQLRKKMTARYGINCSNTDRRAQWMSERLGRIRHALTKSLTQKKFRKQHIDGVMEVIEQYLAEIFVYNTGALREPYPMNTLTKSVVEFGIYRAMHAQLLPNNSANTEKLVGDFLTANFSTAAVEKEKLKKVAEKLQKMADTGQTIPAAAESYETTTQMQDLRAFEQRYEGIGVPQQVVDDDCSLLSTILAKSNQTAAAEEMMKNLEDAEKDLRNMLIESGKHQQKFDPAKFMVDDALPADDALIDSVLKEAGLGTSLHEYIQNESFWKSYANLATDKVELPKPVELRPADVAPYLFEAYGKRRQCVADELCVANKHFEESCILMEFLTPTQEYEFQQNGTLPEQRAFCIMCTVYTIDQMIARLHAAEQTCTQSISPHSYIVDEPGGYCKEAMIANQPETVDGNIWMQRRYDISSYSPVQKTILDDTDGEKYLLKGFKEIGCHFQ